MEPRAFWDVRCHPAGTTLHIGPKSLRMPFEGFHVFIDLEPGVNWSHSALSLLVPSDPTLETSATEVGFPPFDGEAVAPFEPLALS